MSSVLPPQDDYPQYFAPVVLQHNIYKLGIYK